MKTLWPIAGIILLVVSALQTAPAAESSTETTAETATSSSAVRCLKMGYNHYLQAGESIQSAWTNAVRDCKGGIDPSCLEMAEKHYQSLGEDASRAWNDAVRDCRELAPPLYSSGPGYAPAP